MSIESDKSADIIHSIPASQVLMAIINLKKATVEKISRLAKIEHTKVRKVLAILT